MTVRLGFAIAAFLEPEILIVDEVLAVGDAEFQKKAIGKMQEVSSGEGRTVLFVSHNMASVKNLCTKGLLISNGEINFHGDTDTVINKYQKLNNRSEEKVDLKLYKRSNDLGKEIFFSDFNFYNSKRVSTAKLLFKEKFEMEMEIQSNLLEMDGLNIGVRFETSNQIYISSSLSSDSNVFFSTKGNKKQRINVTFDDLTLTPGEYFVTISIRKGKLFYDQVIQAAKFTVLSYSTDKNIKFNNAWGLINISSKWKTF
jgi:lipopolysaccharide transport system ATP-binding protein